MLRHLAGKPHAKACSKEGEPHLEVVRDPNAQVSQRVIEKVSRDPLFRRPQDVKKWSCRAPVKKQKPAAPQVAPGELGSVQAGDTESETEREVIKVEMAVEETSDLWQNLKRTPGTRNVCEGTPTVQGATMGGLVVMPVRL